MSAEFKPDPASVLRAMARNYTPRHCWDHLDVAARLMAADEIDRLRATPAPGAPAGFKLVPIEPTDEMVLAAARMESPALFKHGLEPLPTDGVYMTYRVQQIATQARNAYAAMLDAAPGAPGQEELADILKDLDHICAHGDAGSQETAHDARDKLRQFVTNSTHS